MKKSIILIIVIILILFLEACASNSKETPQAVKNLEKLKLAAVEHPNILVPSFTLTDNNGKIFTNNDLKGKVYLVQGFAPGCSSCAREIATLNKVYNKFKDKGLEIISLDVASEDISGAVNTKKQFNGGDWHWTVDLDNVAVKFGIRTLESTFIVDKLELCRF